MIHLFKHNKKNKQYVNIVLSFIPSSNGNTVQTDAFYIIRSFYKSGIKSILHIQETKGEDNSAHNEVEKYCDSIFYYPKTSLRKNLFRSRPFTVLSKSPAQLAEKLKQNKYPIIFFELSNCYFLNLPDFATRTKLVRLYRVEHHHLKNTLAPQANSTFRKYFFEQEAHKYKNFQHVLNHANSIVVSNRIGYDFYKKHFSHTFMMPLFYKFKNIEQKEMFGKHIIVNADSFSLNCMNILESFLKQYPTESGFPVIISGRNIKDKVQKLDINNDNFSFEEEMGTEEKNNLIENSQILILSEHKTEATMDFYNTLYNGRHVLIIGSKQRHLSEIYDIVHFASTTQEISTQIEELLKKPFTNNIIQKREKVLLQKEYLNPYKISKLMEIIF